MAGVVLLAASAGAQARSVEVGRFTLTGGTLIVSAKSDGLVWLNAQDPTGIIHYLVAVRPSLAGPFAVSAESLLAVAPLVAAGETVELAAVTTYGEELEQLAVVRHVGARPVLALHLSGRPAMPGLTLLVTATQLRDVIAALATASGRAERLKHSGAP